MCLYSFPLSSRVSVRQYFTLHRLFPLLYSLLRFGFVSTPTVPCAFYGKRIKFWILSRWGKIVDVKALPIIINFVLWSLVRVVEA